jgi:hypothetical protein
MAPKAKNNFEENIEADCIAPTFPSFHQLSLFFAHECAKYIHVAGRERMVSDEVIKTNNKTGMVCLIRMMGM